jgi:pantoate--beta-alanine ligase
MNVLRTIDEVRDAVAKAPEPVGFVPTMGALHEGHLSLVRAARERSGIVVMSIFVNPLQFGPGEDFARYPRSEGSDLSAAEAAGVDLVFVPSVDEMYPAGRATTVHVEGITDEYEGAIRPGHFDGVATVVARLLGIVGPRFAFFGRKDAQQLAMVRRLVADLAIPTEIVPCDTVREEDGLALSSRNRFLSTEERTRATSLWRALQAGAAALREGRRVPDVERSMIEILEAGTDGVDYAAVVNPDTFVPAEPGGPGLLIVAARLGQTRLIDNLLVERLT